jgi:predicted secreted hydrolase
MTLLLAGALAVACSMRTSMTSQASREQQVVGGSVVAALSADASSAGFAKAYGVRALRFPADSGPHPAYQTEWWYYTGNLEAADRRHYGYQLTFFRRALTAHSVARSASFATHQIWFAHLALTDVAGRTFHAYERWSREGGGLAGAQAGPLRVWLEDWSVTQAAQSPLGEVVRLQAAQGDIALDLTLEPVRARVLQGDRGLSRKGPSPGNASYYYSQTRLRTHGTVRSGGEPVAVQGASWLDREWSTSALEGELAGWDWFALHLGDGRDLMLYRLRRRDGSTAPFSAGSVLGPDGTVQTLQRGDFRVQALGQYESPATGARYPARWRVQVPTASIDVEVTPWLADQELRLSFAYWEGAVRVSGGGEGYVELTGYAAPASR